MLDVKLETLLCVNEERNFTKAAKRMSLTQPAVSHHISQLEKELNARLFVRRKNHISLTPQGKIVVSYAKKMKAMYAKMRTELSDAEKHITKLKIGITHTAENNLIAEVLGQYSILNDNISITIITDTIKNLYNMLENYELDFIVVEGKRNSPNLCSLMLDTDYLVCITSNSHPLAKKAMVTLDEIKKEHMIMRLPTSATRKQFKATLISINDSIDNFDIALEVDNIATIKDLIRKDIGISILPKSSCMDEISKGKITALPIENLSMIRETNIVYNNDFAHIDILNEIVRLYQNNAEL